MVEAPPAWQKNKHASGQKYVAAIRQRGLVLSREQVETRSAEAWGWLTFAGSSPRMDCPDQQQHQRCKLHPAAPIKSAGHSTQPAIPSRDRTVFGRNIHKDKGKISRTNTHETTTPMPRPSAGLAGLCTSILV